MFPHIPRRCKSQLPFSILKFFSTSAQKPHRILQSRMTDLLLHKHDFSPETAEQVAAAVTRRRNPDWFDSTLSFLKQSGFTNSQLEKIMKARPGLLASNPDIVIKPKIKAFHDLGFSTPDTTEIIANDPEILYRSLRNRVLPSLVVMKGLLGSNAEVAKLLKVSGWFLKYDAERTMAPNLLLLRDCAVSMEQIGWLMCNFPRCLLCKPERMRGIVDRIDEMGIIRGKKMFIHAVRVLGSMNEGTWERKVETFRGMGFSEVEIAETFRKAPQVFSVSVEKMRKLKEVLVASGKYDYRCIIEYPTSLICSIERTYKPRLHALGVLESKNLVKQWPSFPGLYKMTHKAFHDKYVAPYVSEVGEFRVAERAGRGRKQMGTNQ